MIRAFILAALLATPAAAQEVRACDEWDAHLDTIPEPFEDNTRAFANGDVRLALLDTIEPASIPFKLLILHPPYIEGVARTCTVIDRGEDFGFADIDFAALEAAYDPAVGLMFTLPTRIMVFDADNTRLAATLRISVNQDTGDVDALVDLD